MKLKQLQAAACAALVMMSGSQAAVSQRAAQQPAQQPTQTSPTAPAAQQTVQNDTTGQPGLPQAPAPKLTEPLDLRDTPKDYSDAHHFFKNPLNLYKPTDYPAPRLTNTPRLDNLLRDGKIYLSLSDAVTLALENNYDIAIARINLDIADTDILRAKAGSTLRGVSTGLVTGTLGGSTTTISGGGGPGGTSTGSSGSGAGASGLVLSTNGGGPQPENFDPYITGTVEYERAQNPSNNSFTGTGNINQNTATFNVSFLEGFKTGTQLTVGFNNSNVGTNSRVSSFSNSTTSSLRATATQHLLQGCCTWLNTRFIVQAKNDRRITDSAFRQQVIYTITQVEDIYWALVSAYEDEQAREVALQQSTQLSAENRKQLEIGTLAPLDVVNSDATVSTDKQALISSKSNLEYQQLVMKQAIARNLNDPQLANAPVVPTDRVGLDRLPEEDMAVEDLVRQAYVNNPQVEQASLAMENNKITIRAEKNGLLPVLDAFGFYGSSAIAGTINSNQISTGATGTSTATSSGYGSDLGNLFGQNAPDYGVGVSLNIPLRNRTAQADQARSQMEYRQTQMRLQQLYTQLRIQVINAQYALTNDRAQVQAAQAARDYNGQSLEAEQKKYRLGASTTANVLAQERSVATAQNNLISATAAYARDRVALSQILSNTLDRYGISLQDAATGTVTQLPVVPGLTAPQAPQPAKPLTDAPPPPPQ